MTDEERKAIEQLKILIGLEEYNKLSYIENKAIQTALNLINKQESKIKNAIDFINNEKNYFEDGENWENVLKIKEILEDKE